MIIGIDASRANLSKKTGVEWYGAHIIRELSKLDSKNRYRLYSWESLRHELAGLPDNFANIVIPAQRLWSHTSLSAELRRNPVDRLFIPSHVVPRVHPDETTVTVHDLGYRHFRQNYSYYHYLSLRLGTRLSVRWAKNIITPSRTVAQDIRSTFSVPERRLKVIPNGVDATIFKSVSTQEVMDVLKHHKVRDPYLLFLGRLEVRKNVMRVIEAFYRLKDSGLFGGQLVLVGNPGVGYEDIRDMIAKQRQPGDIIHTGYVPDRERAALTLGSRALVFPSLFEGFGIPILEAFAAGTPVLTSRYGATAEVAGEAALLVDPEDVDAIHRGMERLLDDEAYVKSLVAAGAQRVKQFSWRRTAEGVYEVLTS